MPGPQPSRRRTTPSRASKRPSKATSTKAAESSPRFQFIGGKGGVGKTTCAASIAVASAARGIPTLVISTDPAPSLGDALNCTLSAKPRRIPTRGGTLYAAEIDAREALNLWLSGRRAALEQVALRGTWLDQADVTKLLQLSLPGIDELAALLEIARAGRDRRFQHIVVDMAPTGHTLRMLEMPQMLRVLADVFDRMQAKHRVVVAALRGSYAPDQSDLLIAEIDREGRELAGLLRDTTIARVSWVSLAEPMSVAETEAAAARLASARIPLHDVIVNRLTSPPPQRCSWCDGRRVIERRSLMRLRSQLPGVGIRTVMARAIEPRGVDALRTIGRELSSGSTAVDDPPAAGRVRSSRLAPARSDTAVTAALVRAETRLLLFGGKGGVGKTTCAAAAALAIAGGIQKSVLLLSTDPAHSLADVFGGSLGDSPSHVRGGPPNLRVREIDAAAELDRIRGRYAKGIDALFDRLAGDGTGSLRVDISHDREVMHGLIELAPPGIDELAAAIEVVELVESDAVGAIVVDTAPTGHALRLLEMPALVHSWTKAVMSILLKYQPVIGIEEFGPTLLKLSQGLGRLQALLVDSARTSFFIVTRGAALPRQETVALVGQLRRLNIHVPAIVVNAVGRGSCRRCRSEAAVERRHIRGIQRDVSREMPLIVAPGELPAPHGAAALRRWQRRWTRLR